MMKRYKSSEWETWLIPSVLEGEYVNISIFYIPRFSVLQFSVTYDLAEKKRIKEEEKEQLYHLPTN